MRFPKSLVEDMIGLSSKDLTLFGREEKFDMHLSGKKVFFGTAGAAVHVVDVEKKEYRDSQLNEMMRRPHQTLEDVQDVTGDVSAADALEMSNEVPIPSAAASSSSSLLPANLEHVIQAADGRDGIYGPDAQD